MEINEELVGEASVLHVHGRLTIGEPSLQLSDFFSQLIKSGRKKLIVDLNGVPQIDSSGIATLVRCSIILDRNGGSLRLAVSPGRVRDALTVTRLVEAIPTFESVAAALKSFGTLPCYCLCPLCDARSDPPLENRTPACWQIQTCTRCDAHFCVTADLADLSSQPQAILQSLKVFPYGKDAHEEFVEMLVGPPITLHVVGRLDLFTSRAINDALRAIPVPRKALIDLVRVTETSVAGFDALLDFAKANSKDTLIICLEGLPSNSSTSSFVDGRFVHSSKQAALAALGPMTKPSSLSVRTKRLA